MSKHCPYLGLKDHRDQVALAADPRHRCHYAREPERIGSDFQVSTCLTAGYLHCPRLATRLPAARSVSPRRPATSPPAVPLPTVRFTELQPARRRPRRRLKLFEFLIAGLALSIVAAALSLGYAVFYRMEARPGGPAAAALATVAEPIVIPTAPLMIAATATTTPEPSPLPASPMPPSPTPVVMLAPASATPAPRPPSVLPPTRLVIAKIDLDIPVKPVGPKAIREGTRTRIVWGDVPDAGAFHDTSAYPGNSGNTVINGHRDIQGAVFAHLDRVGVGDEIVVYVQDVAYKYQVIEVLVVPETFASAAQRAENRALIGAFPEERLTLVTCTPVGLATHRLVVVAMPPELAVPNMPAAGDDR